MQQDSAAAGLAWPMPSAAIVSGGERRRWIGSTLVAVALHGTALLASLQWLAASDQSPPPPAAAMMIEMAPQPEASAPPSERAPGQEQTAARPVERRADDDPVPPRNATKAAEVALPKPKPKSASKPKTEAPPAPRPVEETTAPVAAEPAPPAVPKAPALAPVPSPLQSTALPTWQGALRAHLERFKRYPGAAQARRQQGAAYVRFVMDRAGKVLSARLDRSAGHSLLDAEALALMERAEPLPAPPPEVTGETIEIVVPIQFFLK